MTALLLFLVPPAVLVVGMAVLFLKGHRRGIAEGLALFAVCCAAGAWAILQSRSSTAPIGFLFLPTFGAIAGALGWAFGALRGASARPLRAVGWVCLIAAFALPAWQIVAGRQTIQLNRQRDAAQEAHAREIAKNRELIAAALAQNPGRE